MMTSATQTKRSIHIVVERSESTVADGVDGRVLDDHALVLGKEHLEGLDDATKVGLVLGGVVDVLGVQDVMASHQAVLGLERMW